MYLKCLEIQGFKSFANKLRFEFHNGITGIVGPNGSGKSNVSDAVRWVLGEQKIKQLRGAKMEDVIFAGTENRKPLGFAFVAITLDNSDHVLPVDFEEVTVSRRLFRSGESEYMINGSACRLKDINELFYDTGIGKDGYSLIGQGQIDKILSGKPEERRELFDEAAGIVKFKRRKKEALKKLDDENQNLVRVEDILSELEKQVGPLEKQSEKAKEYLKLRDELKSADVNLFLVQMDNIRSKLKETEERIQIVTADLTDTTKEFENTKTEYEKLDAFIESLNTEIEDTKNEISQIHLDEQRLTAQIQVLEEQVNSAKSNDEYLNNRLDDVEKEIQKHKQQLENLKSEKSALEESIQKTTHLQGDADSKLAQINDEIHQLTEQVENYKAEMIALLNEKALVQSKMERYDTMIEQIHLRKDNLEHQIKKYHDDKEEQNKIINDLEKEQEQIQKELSVSLENQNKITLQITNLNKETVTVTQQLQESQIAYHKNHSRLESLSNLTERYEGYGNSIRKIMELKDSKKGIVGVVADIIKVDKKYEVAIETALGGSIQNIVTDTETTAKELIEFLKKNKFGRATFLPLSSMSQKTGFTNEAVLKENGVIGLACDLVRIKEEYSGIAKYLLGRTVVVDKIDQAIVLARKYRYTLRMVTLEGEQLNPGGSMSGGTFRNNSNLLGRRREIEDLEKNLENIVKQRDSYTRQVRINKTQIQTLTEELEKIKDVLQQQYLLQNTVRMNLKQAGSRKEELEKNFNNFQFETNQIKQQMNHLSENQKELDLNLQSKENRNLELETLIRKVSAQIESMQQDLEEKSKMSEEKRLSISNWKNKHNFTIENIQRIQVELEHLIEEKDGILESKKESSDTIDSRQQAIANIKKQILVTKNQERQVQQKLDSMNTKREEQVQEHKEFFGKRETISEKISQLDRESFRLNSTKEKLEEAKENHVNYMWNEYELTYSTAKELETKDALSLSDRKKLVSGLKSKIRTLGDVNVNAIEEYKSVGERYEFLKNQHNDLTEAKNNLLNIVDELDRGMRKQFNEKFSEIQMEFDKVFKELFGGGKGEIELEENSDVLEAGIRIISQPPGKKLQNMMQMSGGEKALTAISLLFAIQNLKPSPFCLLDEIEAALDDSNVVRFAEYLHKLTENTQFIVITHRRGTMNAADRLYGITMQEKGISTLVSVNLIEEQLEKEDKAE